MAYYNKYSKNENITNKENISKEGSPSIRFNHKYFFSHLGAIILAVLLLALLVRFSQNQTSPIIPTFTSLLEKLSTAEVPSVPFIDFSTLVLGDWGAFNFLQSFIESILSIFNVLLFFVNGIISAISYLVWFMQWLFIG